MMYDLKICIEFLFISYLVSYSWQLITIILYLKKNKKIFLIYLFYFSKVLKYDVLSVTIKNVSNMQNKFSTTESWLLGFKFLVN